MAIYIILICKYFIEYNLIEDRMEIYIPELPCVRGYEIKRKNKHLCINIPSIFHHSADVLAIVRVELSSLWCIWWPWQHLISLFHIRCPCLLNGINGLNHMTNMVMGRGWHNNLIHPRIQKGKQCSRNRYGGIFVTVLLFEIGIVEINTSTWTRHYIEHVLHYIRIFYSPR